VVECQPSKLFVAGSIPVTRSNFKEGKNDMMDSKQLALIYLMEEANHMASVCTKNVHALQKKGVNKDIEEQMGILFSAMKEVAEEFKLDENNVQESAEIEFQRRLKDR
jgi:hypothetical protein